MALEPDRRNAGASQHDVAGSGFEDAWRERRPETPIGMDDSRDGERAINLTAIDNALNVTNVLDD